MSIKDIRLQEKIEVFLRLIGKNENPEDASSKAGLFICKNILITKLKGSSSRLYSYYALFILHI